MEAARYPDTSDVRFRRELSLIAGSSVDPEVIIRVHKFELDEGHESMIDLNRFPPALSTLAAGEDDHRFMEMSVVLATLRDINSFLEENSQDL